MPRPALVSVIAWVWIVLGALMTFSGLGALASCLLFRHISTNTAPLANEPESVQTFLKLFDWFPVLAAAQVLISPLIVWSGIQFLRLRPWARTALEIVTWLALAYMVVFSIFFIYIWNSMLSSAPQTGAAPPGFALFGTIGALFNMVIFGIPLGLMLKGLRSQAVREACRRLATAGPAF